MAASKAGVPLVLLRLLAIAGLYLSYSAAAMLTLPLWSGPGRDFATFLLWAMAMAAFCWKWAPEALNLKLSGAWTGFFWWLVGVGILLGQWVAYGPLYGMPNDVAHPLDLVTLALLTPIGEECLFRGLAWRLLGGSIWATSLLFGLMHLQYWDFQIWEWGAWIQVGYTFLGGLLLGWLRKASGSIWVPVAVHGVGNLVLQALPLT